VDCEYYRQLPRIAAQQGSVTEGQFAFHYQVASVQRAIDVLGEGDILVLPEWDAPRAACSMAFTSFSASTHAAPC
jgi:hypothetical protein